MNKIMPDKIASSLGYCTSGGLICWGSIARWIARAIKAIAWPALTHRKPKRWPVVAMSLLPA